MDLRDTPEEGRFRTTLRSWLAESVPAALLGSRDGAGSPDFDAVRAWSRMLHEAGYAGLTWPKEYGGGGEPQSQQAILLEELARVEAPQHLGVIGLGMAGPTIIATAREAQKARHLAADPLCARRSGARASPSRMPAPTSPPCARSGAARGDAVRRRRPEGVVVVRAHRRLVPPARAQRPGVAAARGPDLPDRRHARPGVEVRPLRQLTGEAEFNEIFFTGVEVPVENVLGEVGDGWQVAMTTLLHERGTLGFALTAALEVTVRKLVELARDRGATQLQRDAIAREWIELQALG